MSELEMTGKQITAEQAAELIGASTVVSQIRVGEMLAKTMKTAAGKFVMLIQGIDSFLTIETAQAAV